MKTKAKILILICVTVSVIALILVAKQHLRSESTKKEPVKQTSTTVQKQLPRMLELGSTTCIPCQMMEKVLESLKHKYSDQLQVDFVDVTVSPEIGEKYKIELIPTQIFFGEDGKEIFRHEGFFPEKDIVAEYEKLGYTLKATSDDSGNNVDNDIQSNDSSMTEESSNSEVSSKSETPLTCSAKKTAGETSDDEDNIVPENVEPPEPESGYG